MKRTLFSVGLALSVIGAPTQAADTSAGVLGGTEGLACQALLCLSSGTRPSECSPSLSRYFDIRKSKPWKTIRARMNFLSLCPTSGATGNLASAIASGAGYCDMNSLLSTLNAPLDEGGQARTTSIPSNCAAYAGHELVSGVDLPVLQEWCEAAPSNRGWPRFAQEEPRCIQRWVDPANPPTDEFAQNLLRDSYASYND